MSDNKIKSLLRRSRFIIFLYRTFKTIAIFPLRFTSFRDIKLKTMPFKDMFDKKKITLFKITGSYTQGGYSRMTNSYDLATDIEKNNKPGAFVECGVWRGGMGAIMAAVAHDFGDRRKTWYLDSYEGMPEPSIKDYDNPERIMGDVLRASEKYVKELVFSKLKLPKENNIIVKGWFQDTIPNVKSKIGDIAILRLDADWYEATLFCLEKLYDQIVPGGYVIFDDYGRWAGCKQAADEFMEERGLAEMRQFMGNYGARPMFFQKP